MASIARKLSLADAGMFLRQTVIGYVLQYYTDNKPELKFTTEQRVGVFTIQFEALRVLADRQADINQEMQTIAEAFMDLLLSIKDDTDYFVPDSIASFFNDHCVEKPWFSLSVPQVQKVTTSTQAAFFGALSKIQSATKEMLAT
jgi:hypothetical protein